jgi:predicted O-methyltransferase YrrM
VRVGVIPEGLIERIVLRAGLGPVPLAETQIAFTLARLVMVATKLGTFEALADGAATAEEVAVRCQTDPRATGKLLFALASCGYVRPQNGTYELAPVARKWLLQRSPTSLADKMLFQFLEWEWMEQAEEFVRTGRPLELHESALREEDWRLYQRGMRSLAGAFATEAVRRMPLPHGARDMLDIGGSHGYYSVSLCRRHPELRSVVLDLPEAVEQAAPILAEEGMGDRVVHREGDALADDLGTERYDLVLIAQLVHHFDDAQNRELARRVAAALRPGGVYAILDAFRPRTAKEAGQLGALLEFYFALTSEAGTWAVEEMTEWQRQAGLQPRRPIRFRTIPGTGIQAAVKRA